VKIVVTNNQVAELWAAQSQSEARSGSMFFHNKIIYSYGEHFPIAMHTHFKGKPCALKTSRTNSRTTACHMSLVGGALHSRKIVTIYVDDPLNAKIDPEALRAEFQGKVNEQIASALRAITCCKWKMEGAEGMVVQFNKQLEFLEQPLLSLPEEWDSYVARAVERQDECEQRRIARYAAKRLAAA
jgi:hypothetical protein